MKRESPPVVRYEPQKSVTPAPLVYNFFILKKGGILVIVIADADI